MNGNDVRDILAISRVVKKENRNMKTSHTKGPWNVDDKFFIWANGTPRIAEAILRDVSINEQKANARLIAAAPDMLEALERVIKWHETGCDISKKTLLNIQAIIDKVKT